jgi:hypothetical protein
MRTLKLYATGSATANAVANVVIPSASTIRGVQVALRMDSITDNAYLNVEVSRASARETATNGAQQCICEVALANNFLTSGDSQNGVNTFFPVNVAVTQGQIIYLHALVTGTLTYDATFVISYS